MSSEQEHFISFHFSSSGARANKSVKIFIFNEPHTLKTYTEKKKRNLGGRDEINRTLDGATKFEAKTSFVSFFVVYCVRCFLLFSVFLFVELEKRAVASKKKST